MGSVTNLESWRKVFRDGIAPLLSLPALEALRDALADDSPLLIQGATCAPPPLQAVQEFPVEAACALGFCGWKGLSLVTVAEVEAYFARVCHDVDQRLGEPAACRWFLNWYDETSRPIMIKLLLPEVQAELDRRVPVAADLTVKGVA